MGLAVANKVLMLEHAYYTVISPEGCASILFRDASLSNKAAEALKITADDLLKFNIIDDVVKEPLGGAHVNYQEMGEYLKNAISDAIDEFNGMNSDELRNQRYQKFRNMGVFHS